MDQELTLYALAQRQFPQSAPQEFNSAPPLALGWDGDLDIDETRLSQDDLSAQKFSEQLVGHAVIDLNPEADILASFIKDVDLEGRDFAQNDGAGPTGADQDTLARNRSAQDIEFNAVRPQAAARRGCPGVFGQRASRV